MKPALNIENLQAVVNSMQSDEITATDLGYRMVQVPSDTLRKRLAAYEKRGYVTSTTDHANTVYSDHEALPKNTKVYFLDENNLASLAAIGVVPCVTDKQIQRFLRGLTLLFPESRELKAVVDIVQANI